MSGALLQHKSIDPSTSIFFILFFPSFFFPFFFSTIFFSMTQPWKSTGKAEEQPWDETNSLSGSRGDLGEEIAEIS